MENSLAQAIRDNPEQPLDLTATLPSGNVVHVHIGPLINGTRTCTPTFERTAADDDIAAARLVIDAAMEHEPDQARVVEGEAEYEERLAEIRRRTGGANG
jgi:hypothetical protein